MQPRRYALNIYAKKKLIYFLFVYTLYNRLKFSQLLIFIFNNCLIAKSRDFSSSVFSIVFFNQTNWLNLTPTNDKRL